MGRLECVLIGEVLGKHARGSPRCRLKYEVGVLGYSMASCGSLKNVNES